MIAPRLRGVVAVGLLLAVASTAAIPAIHIASTSSSLWNHYLPELGYFAWIGSAVTALLAGVVVVGATLRRRAVSVIVPAVATLASLSAALLPINFAMSFQSDVLAVGDDQACLAERAGSCPGDPGDGLTALMGLVLVLAVAVLFVSAARAERICPRKWAIGLMLLLLALLPLTNLVAFLGLLATTGRDSTRLRVAAGRTA